MFRIFHGITFIFTMPCCPAMLTPAHIREAWKMFRRARYVRRHGFRRLKGTPEEVCRQIVKRCWNGTHFQTSLGHFDCFYMRDFGICVDALMKLGYKEEVHKTLQYALNIYSRNRTLSTTITRDHKPLHVFDYSPDSLPLLLRSLRLAKSDDLLETYRPFIESQVRFYFDYVLDHETGLVRKGHFSSMKDNHRRVSSCYDNCMVSLLKDELLEAGLDNPFAYDYRCLIKKHLWNGRYFFDDRRRKTYISGDAQVFPFWCGVIDDKRMFESCRKEIDKAGLDKPFPLMYTSGKVQRPLFPLNLVLPDYETDTIWMNLGLCWMDVIRKYDGARYRQYRDSLLGLVQKHGTFIELYDPDGKPFVRSIYSADEGMLWAAKLI
jgi:hypothetical protein